METKTKALYGELMAQVKELGLMEKTPSFYIKMFTAVTVLSLVTWGAIILMGLTIHTPLILLVLPLIIFQGALTAQFGFIAHELAHQQVFKSRKTNEFLGMIVANLFAGLSYGFWLQKHNRHHGSPNMLGSDPDINLRVLAFNTEQKYSKPSAERMLTRHQGWLFPILVFFTSFDLLLDSFKSLSRKSGRGHNLKWVEGAMLVVRLLAPVVIYAVFLPLWLLPIAWLTYMLSFGVFLGTAFAVNHIGMPLIEGRLKDSKGKERIGFLERQVLTSRNITPNWFKNLMLGGLNAQIEHHLFPSMSRPNLFKVRPMVIEFCRKNDLKYTEMGLIKGTRDVMKYLSSVGRSTKVDPFVCPLIAQYRRESV